MKKTFLTLTIALFCAITFAQSNGSLWTPVAESEIPDVGKRYIIPSEYQILKLDRLNFDGCLQIFKSNNTFGIITLITILLGRI